MSNNKPSSESERIVETALEMDLRAKNCLVDIQRVLERWNCRINPIVQISGMGVSTNFHVVPIPRVPKNLVLSG